MNFNLPQTPINTGGQANMYGFGAGELQAVMTVITPRTLGQQVIRPYLTNFTHDLQGLMQRYPDPKTPILEGPTVHPELLNAIVPDAQGSIAVDTRQLSDFWTFVLAIDLEMASGYRRHLFCGYFIDEPINPVGMQMGDPTYNPNAKMVITNATTLSLVPTFGHANSTDVNGVSPYMMRGSCDLTPIGAMTSIASDDLFMIDPYRAMANTISFGNGAVQTAFGDASLKSQIAKFSVPTANRLRSPYMMLREFATSNSIAANEMAMTGAYATANELSTEGSTDGLGAYRQRVLHNMKMQTSEYGISPLPLHQEIAISELVFKYPNIRIIPIQVDRHTISNERPQTEICPQNVHSYLVTQVVSAMAIQFNIGFIMFRYSSFDPRPDAVPGFGMYQVAESGLAPLYRFSDEIMRNDVNRFLDRLRFELWPMIRSIGGDFTVMVQHDAHGQTFVDLQFLDSAPIDGIYATNNIMGAMMIPALGNSDHLVNNVLQVTQLTNNLGIGCGANANELDRIVNPGGFETSCPASAF